jgi:D-alanyl-lipoteichoic acid acyltransferase DltB (MBOAT superfamily)
MASKIWLLGASLLFYGYWNIKFLPLLLGSIFWNYYCGFLLIQSEARNISNLQRKIIVSFGIIVNLLLLGYFKYTDFFIANINFISKQNFSLLHLVLPIGISFFTFTQIAYLVDAYKDTAQEYSFINYGLFVTFFPHLLAGPIIHHREMMPQFDQMRNKMINYKNIVEGVYLFIIGLAKKVIVADTFAIWSDKGFKITSPLSFLDAWATSLSYTFQLYFDFSGYTDMALGAALLFNIKLPINFNSPYRALTIQDFWQRWHITLSRFLREYIYIPLGGNRRHEIRVQVNLMITFLIGAFWHGAGWMFLFWGLMHGTAFLIQRIWTKTGFTLPNILAWLITFNFINISWIFFRAEKWSVARNILKGMVGLNGLIVPFTLIDILSFIKPYGIKFGLLGIMEKDFIFLSILSLSLVLFCKNSNQIIESFKPTWVNALFAGFLFVCSILSFTRLKEFLYFNF